MLYWSREYSFSIENNEIVRSSYAYKVCNVLDEFLPRDIDECMRNCQWFLETKTPDEKQLHVIGQMV